MSRTEENTQLIDSLGRAMEKARPRIRKMNAPSRRRLCADMAARYFGAAERKTGQFFNQLRGTEGWKEEDPRELGRRIMAKRNPHYKPKEGGNEK